VCEKELDGFFMVKKMGEKGRESLHPFPPKEIKRDGRRETCT
jgi:hypothetical protein